MMLQLRVTTWALDHLLLSEVRRIVFIQEQGVPKDLEWDEYDASCQHVLVLDNEVAIACGRIKSDGHIGRMAVLANYRRQGVGSMILQALIQSVADKALDKLYLHAQLDAIPFYQRHHFICESETFMDAGIPHKTMVRIR